jgi:hypothetical protein
MALCGCIRAIAKTCGLDAATPRNCLRPAL